MFDNQLNKDDFKEHIENLEKQADAEEKQREEAGIKNVTLEMQEWAKRQILNNLSKRRTSKSPRRTKSPRKARGTS